MQIMSYTSEFRIIEFKGMHIDSKLRMKIFKEYSIKISKVAEISNN